MAATAIPREELSMHKPNNLLEMDVREQLDWDPVLDDTRIVVKADAGKVTLTGAVETFDDVELASMDTRAVGGVKEVDNELMVGFTGAAIADVDIAAECLKALNGDRLVPHGSVTPTVIDGFVTLTGEVRNHFQGKAAAHAVGRIPGVLGVSNDITLTDQPIPTDVADRINKAFKRNAILDDSLIKVSNVGHTIYLDGIVGSWNAMDAALDCAWGAPGVQEVVNRLTIED
jgi:osmotically-inducible protein OsmY